MPLFLSPSSSLLARTAPRFPRELRVRPARMDQTRFDRDSLRGGDEAREIFTR